MAEIVAMTTDSMLVRIRDNESSEYYGRTAVVSRTRRRQSGRSTEYRLALDGHDIGWFWESEIELLEPEADEADETEPTIEAIAARVFAEHGETIRRLGDDD